MGTLGSLLLALFFLLQLVHSFQINAPSNIKVNTLTSAPFKRLKRDPRSWKFILCSNDPNIPDKTLGAGTLSGDSSDFEVSDSVHFSCNLPGTYWIDVVTTDSSRSLIVRSNSIQAGDPPSPTTARPTPTPSPPPAPPPSAPPPSAPPPSTSTPSPSTPTTPTAEVPKPPPTTSTSETSTSSPSTFLVNNDHVDSQSQTSQNLVPISPGTPSSVSTIPSALTVIFSSTYSISPTLPSIIDPSARTSGASTPSSSAPGPLGSNTKRNNTPLIVGIVVGAVLFLVILLGLIWYWNRRRQQADTMRVTPFNGRGSPASDASTAIRSLKLNAMEEMAGSSRDTEKAREAVYHDSDRTEQHQLAYNPSSYGASPPPTSYSMTTLPEYPTSAVSPPRYTRPLPDPFSKA
ncbi:hypothetical protein WG66_010033 [Moniliophthora roreri]|nr:hypothetical protein WG66_010033 [Moniliophthora roreri]